MKFEDSFFQIISNQLKSSFYARYKELSQNRAELGRVVHFEDDIEKIAVIADILNKNRILIDGPGLGVERQVVPIKRIRLTKFKIPICRNVNAKILKSAIEQFDVKHIWDKWKDRQ